MSVDASSSFSWLLHQRTQRLSSLPASPAEVLHEADPWFFADGGVWSSSTVHPVRSLRDLDDDLPGCVLSSAEPMSRVHNVVDGGGPQGDFNQQVSHCFSHIFPSFSFIPGFRGSIGVCTAQSAPPHIHLPNTECFLLWRSS